MKVIEIEIKFNRFLLFLEVNKHSIRLGFIMSEFCIHQLDILPIIFVKCVNYSKKVNIKK